MRTERSEQCVSQVWTTRMTRSSIMSSWTTTWSRGARPAAPSDSSWRRSHSPSPRIPTWHRRRKLTLSCGSRAILIDQRTKRSWSTLDAGRTQRMLNYLTEIVIILLTKEPISDTSPKFIMFTAAALGQHFNIVSGLHNVAIGMNLTLFSVYQIFNFNTNNFIRSQSGLQIREAGCWAGAGGSQHGRQEAGAPERDRAADAVLPNHPHPQRNARPREVQHKVATVRLGCGISIGRGFYQGRSHQLFR